MAPAAARLPRGRGASGACTKIGCGVEYAGATTAVSAAGVSMTVSRCVTTGVAATVSAGGSHAGVESSACAS